MSQPAANDERQLQMVSDAIRRGMTTREIAVLYGEAAVSGEWSADGPMRIRTRRLVRKARQLKRDEHPGPASAALTRAAPASTTRSTPAR